VKSKKNKFVTSLKQKHFKLTQKGASSLSQSYHQYEKISLTSTKQKEAITKQKDNLLYNQ